MLCEFIRGLHRTRGLGKLPTHQGIRHVAIASACMVLSAATGVVAEPSGPDEILRQAVERGDVFNVVAVAATTDGITYQGAFGKRFGGSNEDVSVDSIFRIASMTKAITSVAAMQLIEEEVVSLDDPVSKYIPSFSELKVLEGFDAETHQPHLRAPSTPVTVRHLLTHTSGFGYEIWNPLLREAVANKMIPGLSAEGDGFLTAPLVFDPGSRWHYGINTDWLGRLVATVRGTRLDQVFAEKIFGPLGMRDTHFNLPPSKTSRLVSTFERKEDGGLMELPRETPPPVSFMSGGGGLYSTASDYARFLRALLNDGSLDNARILRAQTVSLMGQNQIGKLEAGAMRTLDPTLSNDFDFLPSSIDRFGLGFLINSEAVAGGRASGSLTWAGLYNTYFWIDRASGVCGVFMTQILPFYDKRVVDIVEAFERAIYREISEL